ncbi:hypothetical protein [Streptomyces acidicola]|uniref:hypothetical protein n=1 Tax=Streptomyces acidicola TaxID=2596892 RepID=UPI001883CAB1|nr:hypothetical protein [Streptomyces acidicola]
MRKVFFVTGAGVAGLEQPPQRFVAGDDCLEAVEAKARQLLAQVDASRELGTNLAHANAS